jgi:butyrate kinase
MNLDLDHIIERLKEMRPDMEKLAKSVTSDMDNVISFIQTADLRQCKAIVDALIVRVSDEIGCAIELEDASCILSAHIGDENE